MISSLFRFHGHNSLRYVYSNGKAVRSQLFTVKYVPNTHRKNSRFSVVVSKKVIKSAVGRNRIRRRLYEYIRINTPRIHEVHDIVIICTSAELRVLPYAQISEQLDLQFTKASLYKTPKN
jgi:ribonuclease P protein component